MQSKVPKNSNAIVFGRISNKLALIISTIQTL